MELDRYLQGWMAYLGDGVEALIPYVHPDVVWEEYRLAPGAQAWHGHEGLRAVNRRWKEDFDGFGFEPAGEPVAIGADGFAIRVSVKGRGRGSGIEIDWHVYLVAIYRDGLLVHGFFSDTVEEAMSRGGA